MPEQEPVASRSDRLARFLTRIEPIVAVAGISLAITTVAFQKGTEDAMAPFGPPAGDKIEYAGSGKLPDSLPPAVDQQTRSVVKVIGSNERGGFEGSGVKIRFDRVLTAGHVVAGDAVSQLTSDCQHIMAASRYSVPGEEDPVTGISYTYEPDSETLGPDIAAMRVTPSPRFAFARTPSVSAREMQRGDTVYFINYELGPEGRPNRYPNASEVEGHGSSTDWHGPAEYAGVVLRRYGSLIAVATGLKGYGDDGRESHTYEGASGGPVFTPNGALTGLSVAIVDSDRSAKEISDYFNVRLPVQDSAEVQFTFVQPVAQSNALYAEKNLAWESAC